jgi:[ribosomal protein S5]-alanine N-acetyltransferase
MNRQARNEGVDTAFYVQRFANLLDALGGVTVPISSAHRVMDSASRPIAHRQFIAQSHPHCITEGNMMADVFDFSSFPVLTTERLRLRPLTHGDVEQIKAIYSDPAVLAFLSQPPTDTQEKALGRIDWFNSLFTNHECVTWGITLHGDDQLIGVCGTYAWDRDDRHVDIGYSLQPAYWGRGYATEASRAVIRWCFDNLNVHRIQADCTDGNMGSERVLLKCGFTVEGITRESCWEHGRFVNIKTFGLLRREFEAG